MTVVFRPGLWRLVLPLVILVLPWLQPVIQLASGDPVSLNPVGAVAFTVLLVLYAVGVPYLRMKLTEQGLSYNPAYSWWPWRQEDLAWHEIQAISRGPGNTVALSLVDGTTRLAFLPAPMGQKLKPDPFVKRFEQLQTWHGQAHGQSAGHQPATGTPPRRPRRHVIVGVGCGLAIVAIAYSPALVQGSTPDEVSACDLATYPIVQKYLPGAVREQNTGSWCGWEIEKDGQRYELDVNVYTRSSGNAAREFDRDREQLLRAHDLHDIPGLIGVSWSETDFRRPKAEVRVRSGGHLIELALEPLDGTRADAEKRVTELARTLISTLETS